MERTETSTQTTMNEYNNSNNDNNLFVNECECARCLVPGS